jgi:hypothetical protein
MFIKNSIYIWFKSFIYFIHINIICTCIWLYLYIYLRQIFIIT